MCQKKKIIINYYQNKAIYIAIRAIARTPNTTICVMNMYIEIYTIE